MSFRVLFLLLTFLVQPLFAESNTQEPQKAILILDASGSMWGKVEGRAKIEIAREVVRDLLADWNPDLHLGLMTYGHRKRGDCDDIELLIPPGKVDKEAFLKAVNQLTPKGKTPLTAAVLQAAAALRAEEERATVILVSDGVETCGKDPCEAAAQLKKEGFDFTAHVVGFDLSATEQGSIRCLADETGGLFLAANDAASLKSALETVVKQTIEPAATPAPTPVPTPTPKPTPAPTPETAKVTFRTFANEGGKEVDGFYTVVPLEDEEAKPQNSGRKVWSLKPGSYEVKVKWETMEQTRQIEVTKDESFDFVLNGGTARFTTRYKESGEEAEAFYTITRDGQPFTTASRREFQLPAGRYQVEAKVEVVTVKQEFEIKPGEVTSAELVLDAGMLILKTTVGESEEASDVYYTIYRTVGMLNPKRERATYGSRKTFLLSAGRYIAEAKWGNVTTEKEVEIKAGEPSNLHLVIEGGVLALSAQDAEGAAVAGLLYEIYRAGTELETSPTRVAYGSSSTFRLPVGKYRITAKHGKQLLSAEVEVTTGKRTEAVLKP